MLLPYNSKSFKIKCEICGYKPECITDERLQTHHIKFQCTADAHGNIDDGMHKNIHSNLVTLCRQCHIKVHKGSIIINGYTDTTNGRKLNVV